MIQRTCQNGRCTKGKGGARKVFAARPADVKRGWGKFCCKSCKAEEQESRTHQYQALERCREYQQEYGGVPCFDRRGNYVGFMDSFSNEEHDCNEE